MARVEGVVDPATVLHRLLEVLERRGTLTEEDVKEVTAPYQRPQLTEDERAARVRGLRGKFKDALSSSEEFMRRKHEELSLNEDA